jgi:hypothetical protein
MNYVLYLQRKPGANRSPNISREEQEERAREEESRGRGERGGIAWQRGEGGWRAWQQGSSDSASSAARIKGAAAATPSHLRNTIVQYLKIPGSEARAETLLSL